MPLTFLELKERLKLDTHPQGLPDNLVAPYDRIVQESLIHLQRWVECLQENNTQLYPFCSTYWDCNTTVVSAPRGRIKRVYTIQSDEQCDKVFYRQLSYNRLICAARNMGLITPPDQTGVTVLEPPYLYADSSTDRCFGRSRYGFYAIHNTRLYVLPYLHSSETLVVEWDGIKRDWVDGDQVPDEPDVFRALRLYLAKEAAREWDKDVSWRETALEFQEALRDLIYECNEERRVRDGSCEVDLCCDDWLCASMEAATATQPDDEVVFANIGDYGDPANGTAMSDVATLVKSWSPSAIITNGDNIYASTDYAGVVGLHYGDYITDDITTNRFWPALGNHDYVDASLALYQAFFTLPNNERYYTFIRYGVQFFIYNTAKNNVAATSPEPDGVAAGTIQANWLQLMLATSTSKWKIVILHDGPYTEHVDFPGHTELRLPFAAWGSDVTISGDAHGYIRYEVGGYPFIVNGAGGAPLSVFQPTPNANDSIRQFRDNTHHGAVKMTATCTQLKLEFITTTNEVLDTLTLTKP